MRKLLLLGLPLTAVIAAGGVYGYVWYETGKQADRLAEAAAPVAELSYDAVRVSLSGEAGITGVRIKPHAFDETIEVDSMSVQAPGFLALLMVGRELSQNRIPAALGLKIAGATVELNGPLGQSLRELDQGGASLSSLLPPDVESLGCGEQRSFGVRQLTAMGYAHLTNDIELSYRIDRDRRVLHTRIKAATEGLSAIEADMELRLALVPEQPGQMLAADPQLQRVELRQQDLGFNQRKRDYCAVQARSTPEAYLANHLELARQWLERQRLHAGPGIVESYGRYLEPDSRLRLVVQSPEPLDPARLAAFSPAQLLAMLQPEVTVNGEPVPVAELLQPPVQATPAVAEQTAKAKLEADMEAETGEPRFRPVDLRAETNLGRFLHRDIRVVTTQGIDHEGRLITVENGALALEKRLRQGNMRFRIPLTEVRSLEVWR